MSKLSELVAVEVMGAKVITTIDPVPDGIYVRNGAVYYGNDAGRNRCERFTPDTNIADAWRVVEKMRRERSMIRCEVRGYGTQGLWEATFGAGNAVNESAPLAICLAALRACGVDEQRIEQARKENA